MKFTGELKRKLEAAGSKEEAHKLLNDAGIELTDEELASVAGGTFRFTDGDNISRFGETIKTDANPPIYANKK